MFLGVRSRHATAVTATAAAAGLMTALAQLPAEASVTSGWRVTKVIGPVAGATYVAGFVATGPGDAWSTWGTCNPCGGASPKQSFAVQRWNGRKWRGVPLSPVQETKESSFSVAFGASSRTNAWLFNGFQDHSAALHWNGRTWNGRPIPSWVVRNNLSGSYSVSAEVFSVKSMWVFSSGVDSFTKPEHFAARYSAGRWTKVQLPGIPGGVSAVSQDDMWVSGFTLKTALRPNPVQILMHWNGHRWSTHSLPRARGSAASHEFLADITGAGAHSVWAQRYYSSGTGPSRTLYLLHWNGTAWRLINIPYPNSTLDQLAPDGHGGLWMIANGPPPSYRWYFYHYGSGRWTRTAVHSAAGTSLQEVTQLAWVPGTRSMLAAGGVIVPHQADGIRGAIWQFGP
jgi:hypothetical protein